MDDNHTTRKYTYIIQTPLLISLQKSCRDGWLLLHVSCYFVGLTNTDDWYMARDNCEAMSSHLAVITSESEQKEVVKKFNASIPDSIWLGGFYDLQQNLWKWPNNETWSFNASFQPRKEKEKCMCIRDISYSPSREWASRKCDAPNKRYLCEKNS